jgi:hypothetical protein
VARLLDESGVLEHLQVLGNGREAQVERLGELAHRRLAVRQPFEDRPPGGIGECRERHAEPVALPHHFSNRLIN